MEHSTDGDKMAPHVAAYLLPATLTIDTVEAAALALKQESFGQHDFYIDASQTEVVTTPGIQLVLSLAKSLEQQGASLRILHPKPLFAQAFQQAGLGAQLMQWEANHG